MLMCDVEIKEAMIAGELQITDFDENFLEAASYDARIGTRALLGGNDSEIDVDKVGCVTISPGDFALLVTKESFTLSERVCGHLGLRSYYGRKGLVLLAGLQIDPGYTGPLVIGAYNAAPRRLTLDYETPFVTIEFHKLSKSVNKKYTPSLEQKAGTIPRIDKDYLRTLETQSLSQLAIEVRELTRNVGAMREALTKYYWPILIGIFLAIVGAAIAILTK